MKQEYINYYNVRKYVWINRRFKCGCLNINQEILKVILVQAKFPFMYAMLSLDYIFTALVYLLLLDC